MLQKIREFCRKETLLKQNDKVVVGVSGGADSVCLLRILCLLQDELELKIEAVHVHHGIRGDEAEEDLHFVEALCQEWKVPLRIFREDVPRLAREHRLSLEEAGRNARYRIFEEVREQLQYDVIAVAHHMDDLAETVLMNMVRGSGIRGMAGISPKRGWVIRPLLCIRKAEIEQWLIQEKILWQTDCTNLEAVYFRNRMRLNLIPQLEASGNERAVEHIAGVAADFSEADAYFMKEAARLLEERRQTLVYEDGIKKEIYRFLIPESVSLPCDLLQNSPHILAAYMVRQALTELNLGLKDISRTHIEEVLTLASRCGGKEVRLPKCRVRLEYDRLIFEQMKEKMPVRKFSVVFRIFLADFTKKVPQNSCINWFDYDKINGNVQLRCRMQKDRICVKAGGSSKKLKDYLIDARMPLVVRERWPLLAMGGRILWIPGYRMDEDLKVNQETKVILEAELKFLS